MKIYGRIIQTLFAIPWIIFGIQHYLYADFVSTLVPSFMPFRLFWAYFTGTAMIAAGLSFIANRFSKLAAILLGAMLIGFILLIHVFVVAGAAAEAKIEAKTFIRPVQDIALACAAFLLAANLSRPETISGALSAIVKICRYIFAVMLIVFGAQQFSDLDFLTAKIPLYFPLRVFWVYLMGIAMIVTGLAVIINQKARLATLSLGVFMLLINLLNYGYLLANNLHEPVLWTGAMVNLAVTFGVFILADSLENPNR